MRGYYGPGGEASRELFMPLGHLEELLDSTQNTLGKVPKRAERFERYVQKKVEEKEKVEEIEQETVVAAHPLYGARILKKD